MNPADEIRATLDVLQVRGWHRGSFEAHDGSGRVCLMGARNVAMNQSPLYSVNCDSRGLRLLNRATCDLFPDRGVMASFNDHPDTTWSDVQLVCKHALNEAEIEQGEEGMDHT